MLARSSNVPSSSRKPTVPVGRFLTDSETQLIVFTWQRATDRSDVGGELVAGLLNDRRSLFKSLLDGDRVEETDDFVFDAAFVRLKHQRASNVADGVTRFMIKVLNALNEPAWTETRLAEMCQANGALHYRMKVWFQAENFLCVKRCFLKAILEPQKVSPTSWLSAMQDGCYHWSADPTGTRKREEEVWMKLLGFIIRNMKTGFLREALKNEPLTLLPLSASTEEQESNSSNGKEECSTGLVNETIRSVSSPESDVYL